MSKSYKHLLTQFETVRLANFLIRVLWKSTALVIAITVRLLTSIILAIVRYRQRNRANW